ncbi:hypothetical protein ACFYWN_35225 [Streptomyces sp. NPDC002917]|uniref:hypothetical protein n=1 Tax=Streptomyces sp. NPDC002917 TaxID=3364671 RepID=UPI0036A79F29
MVTRTRPSGEREVDASHAQAGDAASGLGESTADLSWEGQTVIYENGVRPAETDRLPLDDQYVVADVDLDLLRQERQWMGRLRSGNALYGYGRDGREAQVRAYAQGERPRGVPEAAAAILARHAPLTAVMVDLFRKLQHESRETPYRLEEIRRIGRM